MRRAFALLVTALLLVAPRVAAACSVCFSTTEENRWAFLTTTAFLSLLPLGILGGVGLWLRRRIQEDEQRHDAARLASPPRA